MTVNTSIILKMLLPLKLVKYNYETLSHKSAYLVIKSLHYNNVNDCLTKKVEFSTTVFDTTVDSLLLAVCSHSYRLRSSLCFYL